MPRGQGSQVLFSFGSLRRARPNSNAAPTETSHSALPPRNGTYLTAINLPVKGWQDAFYWYEAAEQSYDN